MISRTAAEAKLAQQVQPVLKPWWDSAPLRTAPFHTVVHQGCHRKPILNVMGISIDGTAGIGVCPIHIFTLN